MLPKFTIEILFLFFFKHHKTVVKQRTFYEHTHTHKKKRQQISVYIKRLTYMHA